MASRVTSRGAALLALTLVVSGVSACAPTGTGSPSATSATATASGVPPSATSTAPVTPTNTSATTTSTTMTTASPSVSCPPAATASASATASTGSTTGPTLDNVRAKAGSCGDMVIFDVGGASSVGYTIGYRDQITGIGKGDVIPLQGTAVLVVNIVAPAYTLAGKPTYQPKDQLHLVGTSGLASVKQVVWAGSFEGQSLVGIGLDKVRPFRVRVAPGEPTQLIVEIAR